MIVRPYYKTDRDVPLVKMLAGLRRCGKSTILDMLKDDLIGSGILEDHVIQLKRCNSKWTKKSAQLPFLRIFFSRSRRCKIVFLTAQHLL